MYRNIVAIIADMHSHRSLERVHLDAGRGSSPGSKDDAERGATIIAESMICTK